MTNGYHKVKVEPKEDSNSSENSQKIPKRILLDNDKEQEADTTNSISMHSSDLGSSDTDTNTSEEKQPSQCGA